MFAFVYFAGHGYMNDEHQTCIMLNDEDPELNFFLLEQLLRAVGSCPRLYTFAVFDCCRISYDKSKERVSRSGPSSQEESKDGENLILVFGCKPNWKVAGESTLVIDFFGFL